MGDYVDIEMEQRIPFMEMVRSSAVAFADLSQHSHTRSSAFTLADA
jgi:hypothetical protein